MGERVAPAVGGWAALRAFETPAPACWPRALHLAYRVTSRPCAETRDSRLTLSGLPPRPANAHDRTVSSRHARPEPPAARAAAGGAHGRGLDRGRRRRRPRRHPGPRLQRHGRTEEALLRQGAGAGAHVPERRLRLLRA